MYKQKTQTEIENEKAEIFNNFPPGITMTKLIYPRENTLSTIILLGVKRRTMIHASYVYDFLETLNPEVVFIE